MPRSIISKIKEKRKLRREDITLKEKLNELKKDLRRGTKEERQNQWEKKLSKVKISNNADDWKQVEDVLTLAKGRLIYPDLVASDRKKAETDKDKIKLFGEKLFICQKKRKNWDKLSKFRKRASRPRLSIFNLLAGVELARVINSLDPKKGPGLGKFKIKICLH